MKSPLAIWASQVYYRSLLPATRNIRCSTSRRLFSSAKVSSRAAYATSSPTSTATFERNDGWQTIIGLEIHAQIRTGRKLFSAAQTSYNDPVNTRVVPLDAAFPGILPVLDHEAIRLSLMTALALQCDITRRSTFDRKHYFYRDIPASYQITQHYNPLARSGRLVIHQGEHGVKRDLEVGIIQLQVEQDTAKSQTVRDDVLIDLNRAGTGLMEIVTSPDMRTPEEAGAFVKKLQAMLRRLGSGDGDMEKGNLRVDVNISVHKPGEPFGTRCEIKNVNSVRFLQQAIEAERKRHIRHYETTSSPLLQETRGLNELTGETFSLRTKEDAEDYRYMPDANLPAMIIKPAYLDHLRSNLPEMPWETLDRLVGHYGIAKRDAETLLALDEYDLKGVEYFEEITGGEARLGKRAVNWIAHELLGQLGKSNIEWTPALVPAQLMREMISSIDKGEMNGTSGKALLKHIIALPSPPDLPLAAILDQLGLSQSASSNDDLVAICQKAIERVPDVADAIRKGNEKGVMRLVGEVMKVSGGKADARRAKGVILDLIKGK